MLLRSIKWFLLLFLALALPAGAQDEDGLLDVDQAFKLEVGTATRESVALRWTIAEGYYLYRERIKVRADTPQLTIAGVDTPAGEPKVDEFLGAMEVYHHAAEATVRFAPLPSALNQVAITVTIQGCHENEPRICYPPHRTALTLDLPPSTGGAPALGPASGGIGTTLPVAGSSSGPTLLGPGNASLPGTAGLALPEEQAFVFEAIESVAAGGILARFTMPQGYYLYRDKTGFSVAGEREVVLGTPKWPAGVEHEDGHFGRMTVYFGSAEIPLPVIRSAPPHEPQRVTLTADFQGCQLDGICYPPMRRAVSFELQPAKAYAASNAALRSTAGDAVMQAAPPPLRSEQDQFADSLRSGSVLTALAVFFVVGLGLAFTPCVLPMVPILSGIIAGAGNITTARALWLSFIYVLATAVIFTIAGVFAGLAGENLQAILQKPAVLVAFAGLFVLLALSMFGFYELQPPAALQNRINALSNRSSGGSTLGVAIMGLLSALLVGPCVAPPLAGAVLYISQQRDPVLGGAALFSMAMGMGAPLMAFGASAGKLMPKAGPWMDTVKTLFGVMFLWLALWMLERVLDPVWIMLLAGMLLIAKGVHLGALERLPEDAGGWPKTWKAVGFAMLMLGVIQFVGVAAGSRDYLRPLEALGGGRQAAAPQRSFEPIANAAELDAALARASAAKQPVLFDFYADWCVECKRMERDTFTDAAVQSALGAVLMLKIDVTDQDEAQVELQRRFEIIGPPATLFFSCALDENRPLRLVGFEAAAPFADRIRQASRC
jgi:thiol:disulfide interchange protein DsbD